MQEIYRIIDANLNRAREGLRVVEELVRLGFADRRLTADLRRMRHTLARYPGSVPGAARALLAARDPRGDVGASLWPDETGREGVAQLVAANMKRTQEAIRVLEEYAKVLGWPVAGLKALRFAAYDLERSILALPGLGPAARGRTRRCRRVLRRHKERCRR